MGHWVGITLVRFQRSGGGRGVISIISQSQVKRELKRYWVYKLESLADKINEKEKIMEFGYCQIHKLLV